MIPIIASPGAPSPQATQVRRVDGGIFSLYLYNWNFSNEDRG